MCGFRWLFGELSCGSAFHSHVGDAGLSDGRANGLHGGLYAVEQLREIAGRRWRLALLRQHESRQRHAIRVEDCVL